MLNLEDILQIFKERFGFQNVQIFFDHQDIIVLYNDTLSIKCYQWGGINIDGSGTLSPKELFYLQLLLIMWGKEK